MLARKPLEFVDLAGFEHAKVRIMSPAPRGMVEWWKSGESSDCSNLTECGASVDRKELHHATEHSWSLEITLDPSMKIATPSTIFNNSRQPQR